MVSFWTGTGVGTVAVRQIAWQSAYSTSKSAPREATQAGRAVMEGAPTVSASVDATKSEAIARTLRAIDIYLLYHVSRRPDADWRALLPSASRRSLPTEKGT